MTLPCAASLSRVAASPSAAVAGGPPKPRGPSSALGGMRARMFGLFFLIVFCCAVGLISVASLIQQRDQRGPQAAGPRAAAAADTALVQAHAPDADQHQTDQHQADQADQHGAAEMVIAQVAGVAEGETALNARIPLDELSDYECVGWRAQRDCRPDGGDDHGNDRACNATVSFGESGFCSVRHRRTGEQRRVLRMHCDSLRYDVRFTCADFAEMLAFGPRASLYEHDATFSVDKCRSALAEDQASALAASDTRQKQLRSYRHPLPNFRRGVLLVVYEKLLESVFASVRALRALGCDLPVEIWYKASETNVAHPLLRALVADYGCFLREIKDARADRFYTKIYAVFYSAFDQVLLLDSDNFAVRDPTYLFDSDEFVAEGAMFWPDFWQPKKTIFNIQPTSFVWEALELEYVDMFEQESGQVLIDRRRHLKALNALMYYAFHPTLLENMRLVWGDKDLFRFAWMKTGSSFHMIAMPPGAAGLKLPDQNIFCGVTMVQHDPQHRIVFLHRNQEKLSSENKQLVWRHVQDFRVDEVPLDQYDVRGANGGRYYPQFKRCYGKDIYYEKAFTVTPVDELPFADLEPMLLEFVQQAADMVTAWRVSRGEGEGDAAAEEEVERALAGPAV